MCTHQKTNILLSRHSNFLIPSRKKKKKKPNSVAINIATRQTVKERICEFHQSDAERTPNFMYLSGENYLYSIGCEKEIRVHLAVLDGKIANIVDVY